MEVSMGVSVQENVRPLKSGWQKLWTSSEIGLLMDRARLKLEIVLSKYEIIATSTVLSVLKYSSRTIARDHIFFEKNHI